jgi:hypothetical protein
MKKITANDSIMNELENALKHFLINGRGVNFDSDCRAISVKQMKEATVLEIEDYKGKSIKVIVL